jgi:hypothetical protein
MAASRNGGATAPKTFKKNCKKVLTGYFASEIVRSHTATQIAKNMRTKALVAAAALLAAGALSSMAQSNVYSLNVVGYYNLALTNGYNVIANQLDLDGTGLNNTVYTAIGTNLPAGTRILAFVPPATYPFVTLAGTTWSGAGLAQVNSALGLGGGVWLKIPANASYPQTVTVVGNVMQGALANTKINTSGYAVVSSMVPQAGLVQTDLKLTPAAGNYIFQWLGQKGTQGYGSKHTYASGTTWSAGQPSVDVGEAFFLFGSATTSWSRNFTVQ